METLEISANLVERLKHKVRVLEEQVTLYKAQVRGNVSFSVEILQREILTLKKENRRLKNIIENNFRKHGPKTKRKRTVITTLAQWNEWRKK